MWWKKRRPRRPVDLILALKLSQHAYLLEAGARIYEYQPTMYHPKVMVVDGIWVSVGSTNFDDRSFRLNQEANLNVHDREFAAEQVAAFERDRAVSREITLEAWRHRPWQERIQEWAAGVLRTQL